MNTVKLEITTCRKCPHFLEGSSYSLDGFDRGSDWFCKKMNDADGKPKKIYDFVEWNWVNKMGIPDNCPLLNSANKQ